MLKKMKLNRYALGLVIAATAVCSFLSTARADVWYFTAHLDGDQVAPPTTSEATGVAHLSYDDETNLLQVDVFVEGIGLDNDLTAAHIHIGRVGFSGPWNIQLGPVSDWFVDGTGIRRILVDEVYPEADEKDLLSDGTFIMIHTVDWPGGEIRGQVIQEPRLTPSALGRNRPAFLQVINAQPTERVYFVYSTEGLGVGRSIPELGGLTLDILESAHLLGSAQADSGGTAMFNFNVPADAPLLDVFWQAVIARGAGGVDSVKSNTASTVILP